SSILRQKQGFKAKTNPNEPNSKPILAQKQRFGVKTKPIQSQTNPIRTQTNPIFTRLRRAKPILGQYWLCYGTDKQLSIVIFNMSIWKKNRKCKNTQ
ncbi:MAG: hypothetical protein JW804_00980, partial [Sedimentisphaerales bacterium]|nr:hypothetical protein [Sedimentisphaerales bacterium]